jgi:hypothetical protein
MYTRGQLNDDSNLVAKEQTYMINRNNTLCRYSIKIWSVMSWILCRNSNVIGLGLRHRSRQPNGSRRFVTCFCPLDIVNLKVITNSHFAADIRVPCYGEGFLLNFKAFECTLQRIQVNSRRKLFRLIIGQVGETGEESWVQPIKM